MASLNKVLLIGRLTRDPESRFTPSGTAVTEFGFAVNRYYSTQNGEKKEDTCFLDVSAWGRLGEQARNYLRKGRQAFIEGHLTFSEWQTQEGQKRTKIRVVADNIQFLDSAGATGGPRAEEPSSSQQGGGDFPQEKGGSETEAPF